jgi:hypothetical protein
VSGYVYVNGVPVENAVVNLTLGTQTITVETRVDFGTGQPYYFARLDSSDWLNAHPGDEITITARANGQQVTDTFIAQEGGQQIDLVLPRVSVDALWARADLTLRKDFSLAYDSARDRLVLFGGLDPDTLMPLNDTWEFDGTSWIQRTPLNAPSPRYGHVMVYDAGREHMVLFGGHLGTDGTSDDETWEWDGTNWTQVNIGASYNEYPPMRGNQSMVYDSTHEQVVLFGGFMQCNGAYGCDDISLDDTWAWNGQHWTDISPDVSPQARMGSAMTYDPVRQRIVLFSGWNANVGSHPRDTWEFDGTSWLQRTPINSPSGRAGHSLVYDPTRGRVVLFGGLQETSQSSTNLQETWEWTGMTWVPQSPTASPAARSFHGAAYDSAHNRVVVVSGDAAATIFSDMWHYDGTTWSQQAMSEAAPVRLRAAMEYEHTGTSLLFGGYDYVSGVATTYRWTGNGWRLLSPGTTPPGRYHHGLARNSDGSLLLMFGGMSSDISYLDDTWLWNGTDWQVQSPTSHPSARASYSLTYDSSRDVWVLFGGQNTNGVLGDVWEYDGTDWTPRTFATSPKARAGATLTYDASRNVAVLVGGQGSNNAMQDDVWEYDGSTWRDVTPEQPLAARFGHRAVYDSTRQNVVIAGGMGTTDVFSGTWEWNGSYWRQRITTPSLPGIYHFGMAYDAEHDRIMAAGGEGKGGVVHGTYVHQVIGTPTDSSPIATISRLFPRDARQGTDTIHFEGRGADADDSNIIQVYRWSYLQEGEPPVVFGTQATLAQPADDLPLGELTIRLEVQDNEGTWSQPVEERIYVRTSDGGGPEEGATWTVLIYAAADNSLNPWMGSNADINGMLSRLKNAGPHARVQVAILYDGAEANDTRRYILSSTGSWTEQPQDEARMDEMETLRDFIEWGYETFPSSDHYVLALADHANGIVGFAEDLSSPAPDGRPFLTPLELRSALEQATDGGARKIDVLHYDGCSFGLYETAAIADGLAHYVIASPTTAWGIFAYERYRAQVGPDTDPRAYALATAQVYADQVGPWNLAYTVAVYDMAQFETLDARISTFGDALLTYVEADRDNRIDDFRTLRENVQKYDSGGLRQVHLDNEDAYVDIVDLAEKVRMQVDDVDVDAAASALIDAVQGNGETGLLPFVIYEQHATHSYTAFDPASYKDVTFMVDLDQAHGIGLFYPPRRSTSADSAYIAYIQHELFHVTRDNGWTRFIGNGLPPQSDAIPAMPNNELMVPLIPTYSPSQRIFVPFVSH